LLAVVLVGLLSEGRASDELRAGFVHPPEEAKLRCFWWWLGSNVTKAAITRDLEEMKAKGFGGALIFDADGSNHDGNARVPVGPTFLSPEWRELFRHAVREAERVGLELSLNIQSGWNLGGPMVTPEHAAKQLTWSEARVSGGDIVEETLPQPAHRLGFYRDIAVVAYPAPDRAGSWEVSASSSHAEHVASLAADGNPASFWVSGGLKAGEGPSSDRPEWLQIELREPVAATGVWIAGRPGYGPRSGEVQVAGPDGRFEKLCDLAIKDGSPTVVRFEAVRGETFRMVFHDAHDRGSPAAPRNVQVSGIALLKGDGREPIAGAGPIARRIARLEDKLAMRELRWSAPDGSVLLDHPPSVPGEQSCRSAEVLDLTDKMDPEGTLRWSVPEGDWVVVRVGYTCSGAHVRTSSHGWTGLVVDYLDADALRWYWQEVVEPLIDDAGPAVGKTWKYVHTDSWECGGMSWTPGFRDEFRERRGYDVLPFLPIVTGKIVDSRAVSHRLLADFRKTIGDCIAENHYAVMKQLAHEHGIGTHPESGGPHGAPIDSLRSLGISDIPMSEFWARSWRHRVKDGDRFFVKQPASAAHTYGRRLVAAEGFTTIGPHWQETLWDNLKPSFDRACCEGLNRLFWTLVACSPKEMGLPGQDMFAGTHFNPNSTWWDKSHAFLTYLNRCQYLLQQGLFVADVCYYYGDHVPNFTQLKKSDPARILPGYDYDVATEEVVLTRMSVEDGRIVLPDGMSYRLLVLQDRTNVSLPVLRKIKQLVEAGATVVGPKPRTATGLTDYPRCDEQVREIADLVWGPCDGRAVTVHTFGKGRVIWGPTAREVLAADGLPPDAQFLVDLDGQKQEAPAIDYIHRRTTDADIYFVSNQDATPAAVEAVFRVVGRQPELWEPVSGTIRDAVPFKPIPGGTAVGLALPPYGSMFVIFRRAASAPGQAISATGQAAFAEVLEIAGPWQVQFDPEWLYPTDGLSDKQTQGHFVFESLQDWTKRPEAGIRHYAGTAVYRKTFDLPAAADPAVVEGRKLYLNLGTVKQLAEGGQRGANLRSKRQMVTMLLLQDEGEYDG
jgi:hypothetical protein